MTDGEGAIRDVVDGLREKWGSFPERVTELPGVPYRDFTTLRAAIAARQVILQRFSPEYGASIFALFATPAERAYMKFVSFIGFAGPLAGIVLAFTVRWWWLIPGLLTPFLVMREHKKVYNSVIYRGAVNSEQGFCFLYRIKQISLTSPNYRSSLYWQD